MLEFLVITFFAYLLILISKHSYYTYLWLFISLQFVSNMIKLSLNLTEIES